MFVNYMYSKKQILIDNFGARMCFLAGIFSLGVPVDALFFIGNQLVATSHTGKVGVWNAVTQHWQVC